MKNQAQKWHCMGLCDSVGDISKAFPVKIAEGAEEN